MSKSYYRVMLGKGSQFAQECLDGGFVGTDFDIGMDLSGRLPDEWRTFNDEFIPVFLDVNPGKTRIGAGLACGSLWTVSKGILQGDIVLCPDGSGNYRVGEVASDYYFAQGEILPHRRRVKWLDVSIPRTEMSEALQRAAGTLGTQVNLSGYANEIERLIDLGVFDIPSEPTAPEQDAGDPMVFALEEHLEDFLVRNWQQTELAREYSIYEEDGVPVGRQYPTDAGRIDILAVSHDNRRILVIELKRGRAVDVVVGQTLRYMGYLMDQVATEDQVVEGFIIALEDDQKLRWALRAVPNVRFFRYRLDFTLDEA